MKVYESIIEALNDFQSRGYREEFRKEPTCLYCHALNLWIAPEQFNIDEFYIFDQDSDPGESSIVYAISSYTGVKGTLVDAYGVYSESVTFDMAQKLEVNYR